MSNSSLANYIDRSNGNYSARKSSLIDRITIHAANKYGDRYVMSELINSTSGSSYHYGISSDGTIGLFVDEFYRSWSTGSDNDDRAVNIFVLGQESNPMNMTEAGMTSLINLCTDICRRNFIRELSYTGSPETSNLTMHKWYSDSSCPGPYIEKLYPSIASAVTLRLKSSTKATNELEAAKAQSTIALGAINPYMATVDPSAKNVSYESLKAIGVIGVMFWAGELYDSSHIEKSYYRNPHLKEQVAAADESYMPYALYATTRARSAAEARKECNELFLVVSKYPPKLGIWVNFQTTVSSKVTLKSIVDTYYDNIVEWGLKDKCGFYCTRQWANMIDWPSYTDKFALWLIDKENSLDNINQLLTPTLFKI